MVGFDRFISFVHLPFLNSKRLVCRTFRSHPVSSCFNQYGHLIRPLCSDPITGSSTLLRIGPPQSPASVLSPCGLRRLSFSLGIRSLVPAVPRESLYPNHAPSTPVAARPVIRLLADWSQDDETVLVSTTLTFITTRLRRVHFRSSFEHAPARISSERFIRRSPPRLFTAAARTGLRSAPESRSRRAVLHHSRSFTLRS
ncbi:hypothetical protein D9M68_646760 [compost metagenome]